MSTNLSRVTALKALVAGSVVANSQKYPDILFAFDQINRAQKVRRRDCKRLLQVVHANRALDTTLKESNNAYRVTGGFSMSQYLKDLVNHNKSNIRKLPKQLQEHYELSIVRLRNRLMHESGVVPQKDSDMLNLLSEMHSCLQTVVKLRRRIGIIGYVGCSQS